MGLAIHPSFLEQLQRSRGLNDAAFARACGVSPARLNALADGATPTMLELSNILLGFNCGDKGIPMIASKYADSSKNGQKLVA